MSPNRCRLCPRAEHLTRQSILLAKKFLRRGWTRGSSPRVTEDLPRALPLTRPSLRSGHPLPATAGRGSPPSPRRDRCEAHQLRLKPALRLFEISPAGVSLTEPVTLNGPPNSFCSALSVRSHLSSMLEMSA